MFRSRREKRLPLQHGAVMLLAFSLLANAQQVGQNTTPGAPAAATFQTSTQLVIEAVTVKDKDGKSIPGLTAKDFTVTEDGQPQTIKFFEFQKLDEVTNAPVAPAAARVEPYAKLTRTQIAPEPQGDLKNRGCVEQRRGDYDDSRLVFAVAA